MCSLDEFLLSKFKNTYNVINLKEIIDNNNNNKKKKTQEKATLALTCNL